MRPMALRIAALAWILGAAVSAHAEGGGPGLVRISGLAGYGQTQITSAESGGGSATESPLAFGFALDTRWREPYYFLAEHMRSYGNGSTSVGLTGVGIKYYPWLHPSHYRPVFGEAIPKSTFSAHGYMYYFGASTGFAQASVPGSASAASSIAVSFYLSGKAGVDVPLDMSWSLKAELGYALSFFGSGSVNQLRATAGVAYCL